MWYQKDRERFDVEKQRIAAKFPGLALRTDCVKSAIVTGTMRVVDDLGYSTFLLIPNNHPDGIPALLVDPEEIPWQIERHVFKKNGRACLCVSSEYRIHWPRGSDLADFLETLVKPFFLGQLYFQSHGTWPPTGERSHGKEGIIEAYADLLDSVGNPDEATIKKFMGLLARKNHPKGHEICPCGSGKRLRKCHRSFLSDLRSQVEPELAALDYQLCFGRV